MAWGIWPWHEEQKFEWPMEFGVDMEMYWEFRWMGTGGFFFWGGGSR